MTQPPLRADLEPVAMAPDAPMPGPSPPPGWRVARRVHVEVAGQVALAPRRPRSTAAWTEWAGCTPARPPRRHRLALLVPGLHGAAQQAALHLAGGLRQLAVAADEGAAKSVPPRCCTTRCRALSRPALNCAVPQFCCTRRQRRAGGAQRAHASSGPAAPQVHTRLHAVGKEGRARAEEGHAGSAQSARACPSRGALCCRRGCRRK
jgi:hypothetical protein